MGMQGDLVNGLCYTLCLPAYVWLWLGSGSNSEEGNDEVSSAAAPGSSSIIALFLVVAMFSWLSWYHENSIASTIANVAMAASIAAMNLYQWPHRGVLVIFPQYLWSLLIVSFNTSLSFWLKIGITVNALGMALFVAFKSPLLTVSDALPTLLGVTTVHVLFHFLAERRRSKHAEVGLLNARLASMLLAGAFSYHMTVELSKMMRLEGYAIEGGYMILRAGLFAALGLVAAGAFHRTEASREMLEYMVCERTKAIALQAEELRMVDYALQASETAIAITDINEVIVWSNPALERLTNYPEELRGNSLASVLKLPPKVCEQLSSCFDANSECKTDLFTQDRYFSVEVSPFPALSSSSSEAFCGDYDDHQYDQHDHSVNSRFLVALKDVTEQRARERAEKIAEQEMFLKQGMKDSMETLTHELRSPLQGIMGMASCLLDNGTTSAEDARESLSIIMASSRHLLTLINNLLDVRKCDAKMMEEFPLTSIPLGSSMTDATTFCRPIAAVTNIKLELQLDPKSDRVYVHSNTVRLQQVLINLVSNSIKFAPPQSTVHLTTEVMSYQQVRELMKDALSLGIPLIALKDSYNDASRVAVISVRDSGPGISDEHADTVFHKFSTGNNSNKEQQPSVTSVIGGNHVAQPSGTGLGLNLCLKFVQRMRGNIWVRSNGGADDGGACFSFFVPVSEDCDDNHLKSPLCRLPRVPSLCELDAHSAKAISYTMANVHVLVVDDTIINLKVLERMLKGMNVGKVATASSGKQALSLLQRNRFHLVITDIQMPEMDGLQLADAIQHSDQLFVKPLVVGLTAATSDTIPEHCSQSGLSQILYKPITATQLQRFFCDALPLMGAVFEAPIDSGHRNSGPIPTTGTTLELDERLCVPLYSS